MYERIKKIPTAEEVKNRYRITNCQCKNEFDYKLKEVFTCGSKLLLIVGPCSADDYSAVLKYCEKLKRIAEKVEDKIFIVPRIYTTKPRSEAGAYKGILHSPDGVTANFCEGIFSARKLMVDVAEKFNFFAADEMLYPEFYQYFDDLVSYITIGARSSEDQLHRLMASCMDVPVGIKNPTNGNLKSLAQAIKIVNSKNDFGINGYEVVSSGNKFAHAILRGFIDQNGKMNANYSDFFIEQYINYCNELKVDSNIIIDCNHCNSGKDYNLESQIAIEMLTKNPRKIRGLMIESYLLDGKQGCKKEVGKSLTDGCLGIEKTERLIYEIAEKV